MPTIEQQLTCSHCGRLMSASEATLINGRIYCSNCIIACTSCGRREPIDEATMLTYNNRHYCEDCCSTCSYCEERVPTDYLTEIGDNEELYCHECIEENCTRCSRCETLYDNNDIRDVLVDTNNEEHYESWCTNCIEEEGLDYNDDLEHYELHERRNVDRININNITWTTGPQMDEKRIYQAYLNPEGARKRCPLCMNESEPCANCLKERAKWRQKEETTLWVYDTQHCCYHENDHNRFKGLTYRVQHEHPYLYYGIELETLFGRNENKQQVVRDFIIATNGLFVSEYDRSIDEIGNGAEFISRPLSYKAWTSPEIRSLLEAGMKVLEHADASIDQPKGCGLHVHMSLNFFEHNTKKKVEEIKDDMDWFFQIFQPEIEAISGRKYTRFCLSKKDKIKDRIGPMISRDMGINVDFNIKKGNLPNSLVNHDNHYYAVVQTKKTIEVRTFKSTLDINRIIATIQFCRAIAHAARNMTITKDTTFDDIISCKEGAELTELVHKLKLNTDKKFSDTLEVK